MELYNDYEELIFEWEFKNDKRWNCKGNDGLNSVVYDLINGNEKIKNLKKRIINIWRRIFWWNEKWKKKRILP